MSYFFFAFFSFYVLFFGINICWMLQVQTYTLTMISNLNLSMPVFKYLPKDTYCSNLGLKTSTQGPSMPRVRYSDRFKTYSDPVLLLKTNTQSGYTILDLQYFVALEYFIKDNQISYFIIIKKATSSQSGVSISLPMLTGMLIVIDLSKMPRFIDRERERQKEREREGVYYAMEHYNCSSTILEC